MANVKTFTSGDELYAQDVKDNLAHQKKAQELGYQGAVVKTGYTDTPNNKTKYALTTPGGTQYYNEDEVRYVKKGTSGADEDFMSADDYQKVQNLKDAWGALAAQGQGTGAEAQALHQQAEAIRAKYGYTGDSDGRTDGGGYAPIQQQLQQASRPQVTLPQGSAAKPDTGSGMKENDLTSLLEEWKRTAAEQANGQIDYAVSQAITELERALADSQNQFKEQAEAVARDEMQSLDNSALYAEARGDKGGIGHSQYNEIQAAAAQNRLAVQQAQTKMSTDTARQIADLRAQGEFEKADKLLEITQNYLSQLVSLEQWAAEFGLSQQQFQESIRQWEAEYELALRKYDDSLVQTQNNQYADMGSALLDAGIMPSAEQLTAMGLSEAQAQQYLMQMQLEAAGKGGGGAVSAPTLNLVDYYTKLRDMGITDPDDAAAQAKLWGVNIGNYEGWLEANPANDGGLDGNLSENTLAWARKVYSAQGGSLPALAEALANRGFSDEDINAILLVLEGELGAESK